MNDQPREPQQPEGRLHRLAERLAETDPSMKFPRRTRVLMTIGPFAGFGVFLVIALLVSGYGAVIWLTGIEIGSFIGFGKFVIFGGVLRDIIAAIFGFVPRSAPPSPWVMAGMVVYGDIGTALVLIANMSVLYRMGGLGRRLAACHEAGWRVLRANPWMRGLAWLGVAVFVAAPFQGTGAVIGTILARILGLSWFSTVSATAAGSVAGCVGIALLGQYARTQVEAIADHPIALILALGISILVLVLLGRWFLGQSPGDGTPPEDGAGPAS